MRHRWILKEFFYKEYHKNYYAYKVIIIQWGLTKRKFMQNFVFDNRPCLNRSQTQEEKSAERI